MMEKSSLTEDGNYRAQQDNDEARLAYIVEVVIRLRARQSTADDIAFIENELLPDSIRPHQGK